MSRVGPHVRDTAETNQPLAVRNLHSGKAHLDTGERAPWRGADHAVAACGRFVESFEVVPWGFTAPEDRCKRCTTYADTQTPISQGRA